MKTIINGNVIRILGENEVIVKDSIPIGCYDVCFNKMSGPFLKQREQDLTVKEKIYGNHKVKAEKAFNTFERSKRNLGILLSGKKGIGKTIFVNMMAEMALDKNFPVLICSTPFQGLTDFLQTITQEVVVIFDEFEKNFKDSNEDEDDNYSSDQTGLLSLFDGLAQSKKLFLVTCNNEFNINPYFINRPGRFHYHFKLKNPLPNEIRNYLMDNLDDKYRDNVVIDRIINMSYISELTYDWLRAIAMELNCGSSLEEAIEDLNITLNSDMRYVLSFLINGELYSSVEHIPIGDNRQFATLVYPEANSGTGERYKIFFNGSNIVFKNNALTLSKIDHICPYVSTPENKEVEISIDDVKILSIEPLRENSKTNSLIF